MTLLDDLEAVLGGDIHEADDRAWLETNIEGLRAFVICQRTQDLGGRIELAVFTQDANRSDRFDERSGRHDWLLEDERVLPRLTQGFLFSGCRHGILFANGSRQSTPENIASALAELAEWARKRWHPGFRARGFTTRPRTRNQQLAIVGVVTVAVINAMTLRSWVLATLLMALVLIALRRLDVADRSP